MIGRMIGFEERRTKIPYLGGSGNKPLQKTINISFGG
jgi:hypothetical protein